jgi:type IV pilus assembly protein PilA
MKQKNRNRGGFSLIELIVVLVILAVLSAALVPTLIGYIKQTRERDARDGAAACVKAAQTIVSAAYADPDGKYYGENTLDFKENGDFALPSGNDTFYQEILYLSEQNGTVSDVTVDSEIRVKTLTYTTKRNGITAEYDGSTYTIVGKSEGTT